MQISLMEEDTPPSSPFYSFAFRTDYSEQTLLIAHLSHHSEKVHVELVDGTRKIEENPEIHRASTRKRTLQTSLSRCRRRTRPSQQGKSQMASGTPLTSFETPSSSSSMASREFLCQKGSLFHNSCKFILSQMIIQGFQVCPKQTHDPQKARLCLNCNPQLEFLIRFFSQKNLHIKSSSKNRIKNEFETVACQQTVELVHLIREYHQS